MKTAIEMAAEAGFNIDLPVFKDGTAIALKLIEIAQREEREACAKVCEQASDTGNDDGIERDVFIWNKATEYCVRRIADRSNAEVRGAKPIGEASRSNDVLCGKG